MATSLNNTHLIEKYLQGTLSGGDRLVFEARLLLNRALRTELYFQRKAYYLVKIYHRQKVKKELETLHRQIFNNPDNVVFQQNIYQLFKSKNV
jgi:hypothetical protein